MNRLLLSQYIENTISTLTLFWLAPCIQTSCGGMGFGLGQDFLRGMGGGNFPPPPNRDWEQNPNKT